VKQLQHCIAPTREYTSSTQNRVPYTWCDAAGGPPGDSSGADSAGLVPPSPGGSEANMRHAQGHKAASQLVTRKQAVASTTATIRPACSTCATAVTTAAATTAADI
jgi:hypothetical protein